MTDLTEKQVEYLRVLHERGPLTALGVSLVIGTTENAARKALVRLVERELVARHPGEERAIFEISAAGTEIVAPKSRQESGDTNGNGRPYTVLEQVPLRDLLKRLGIEAAWADGEQEQVALDTEVYVVALTTTARNTEHAYRQVGKGVYAKRSDDYEPDDEGVIHVPSVAIDGKRWNIVTVNVAAEPSVSIG